MPKEIEQTIEEQASVWSGVRPPNAASIRFAAGLASVVEGFERLRGDLRFEDEPSSFELVLQETKERSQ